MSTFPVACTIVSNNYLAYARVLTRSFLAQHPDGKVYVLIVDQPDPSLRYEDEPFTAVFVESLGIPGFRHYSFRYSILELNTAVKPWFLLHLHRLGGYDRICYFDPDILITGNLSEIYDRLGEADAVLTPHITAPLEDDRTPAERDFLLSGMYNLGFLGIAFNERTLPYLDWWHRRLYKECLHEVERGLFVDQRWMDFAPSFLARAVIYRDLGCNVAYWNLTHRSLSRRDGAWWVDGTPLRFFHFSGYRLDQPETISRYQNRFHLDNRPDLAELFHEYGERITAEGHPELQRLPYRFGFFDDGTPVPHLARVALRRTDPDGKRWPDPFAASGPDTFLSWLAAPDLPEAEIFLPRFALILWDHRADLREAFPRPEKEDRARFAGWFAHGMESPVYGETFTRPVAESLSQARHLPPEQAQVVARKVTSMVFGDRSLAGDLPPEEVAWLTADAGHEPQRRPRISRLALMLHQRRADLRGSYPDPLGADRERFAMWFATYGRLEYHVPLQLVDPVLRSLHWRKTLWAQLWWERQRLRRLGRASPPNPLPPSGASLAAAELAGDAGNAGNHRITPAARPAPSGPGLNVVGWASAPTGVGEACRGTLLALETSGVPTALWNLGACAADDPLRGGTQGLPFDTILFHVNADMIPVVTRQLPRSLLAGRYRIGYWFWELSHFPLAFVESFRHLDEIWAPTRFCLDAFKAIAPMEVRWMPPCVAPPTEGPADRQAMCIPPESFLFYFAFDALSIPQRKNPDGLLRAFARAVRESRRPLHLLLKVNHLDADPALGQHLLRQIGDLPVTLLTDPMSRAEVNSLMAACDAYVSLHRSEGLGLPLIEAMYLGKPVIATGYGGVTDFFDDSTGWVVRHTMVALEEAQGPYPVGAVWADPDPDHAAELMLQIAAAPEAAAGKIEAARRRIAEIYSPGVAGARLQRELGRLAQLRDEPVRTHQRHERPAVAG
jgi:glycosyltransferase involved in cell wall biosynthesis